MIGGENMTDNFQFSISNFQKGLKRIFLPILGIIILFFLLRLPNLTIWPIFADEAIYLRWAQVMRNEPTLRFLPLSDGKQPFYMWIAMASLRFFADPLFGGRLISVFAGFGSLVGIMFLTWQLFKNKKTVFLAGLFLAVTPYFVFFDRLALVDSLLTCFGIWTFLLAILLARNQRLDLAMITGLILGLALITKSPALFFALFLPVTILFKDPKKPWWRLIGLWLVAYGFGFAIYNLLRLGPGFEMIAIRNRDYVFPFAEILQHPHDPLKPHLHDLAKWLPNLFTWPVFLLAFLGAILCLQKPGVRKKGLFLLLISLGPIIAQSVVARTFTPRYLLFAVWPLVILAAWGLKSLSKQPLGLLILVLIWPLYYDWHFLTNPQASQIPRKMRSGYLEEWSSGYGINEVRDFIFQRLEETDQNLLVGTEGFFGTLPDGLQIYFDQHPRVLILGVGQPVYVAPPQLLSATIDNEVYLVVNQSRMLAPDSPPLQLVGQYPKASGPQNQDYLLLYRVLRSDG